VEEEGGSLEGERLEEDDDVPALPQAHRDDAARAEMIRMTFRFMGILCVCCDYYNPVRVTKSQQRGAGGATRLLATLENSGKTG
jgi:hypothetical protein